MPSNRFFPLHVLQFMEFPFYTMSLIFFVSIAVSNAKSAKSSY